MIFKVIYVNLIYFFINFKIFHYEKNIKKIGLRNVSQVLTDEEMKFVVGASYGGDPYGGYDDPVGYEHTYTYCEWYCVCDGPEENPELGDSGFGKCVDAPWDRNLSCPNGYQDCGITFVS